MGRFAVFVDAGYFWVQTISSVVGTPRGSRADISIDFSRLRAELLRELNNAGMGSRLLRVYWYDGPGQHGKGTDHLAIDELDDFKLRLGARNNQGQQKAVDGLIIADILSLTQSRAIETAFLLSGDADLVPGVIAAQALGLRVHLGIMNPETSTSAYLKSEVDRKFYFSTDWPIAFASRSDGVRNPIPHTIETSKKPSDSEAVSTAGQASWMNSAAAKVLSTVRTSPDAALLKGIEKGRNPIPPAIDRMLLSEARRELGRALNESEKRSLRATLRAALR